MKFLAVLLATAALAACSEPPSSANTASSADVPAIDAAAPADAVERPAEPAAPADSATSEADYLGRWTGVEGMYLLVEAKPGGGMTLEMQWDLDNKGTFDGSVTAEGLRFMREGVAESAVHTRGDATGLKYLADKTDCLTVRPGEGYCRD